MAEYQEKLAEGALSEKEKEPIWQEWDIPALKQMCIQANANVVKLEASEDSMFDYWLRISTLERYKTLLVPVKLAEYHKKALTNPKTKERRSINSSVTLNKRDGVWWLTLSYDEEVTIQTSPATPVIGIDVGLANFITASDGKHYGTFNGKLKRRHQRDREKRRRKAKLRGCLEKKGATKLPSTSSRTGQHLIRHTRQSINRAVNECFNEHPDAQFAYEQLSAANMKFKARAMNAYLRASNLAHIPKQIAWNSEKRGIQATKAKASIRRKNAAGVIT